MNNNNSNNTNNHNSNDASNDTSNNDLTSNLSTTNSHPIETSRLADHSAENKLPAPDSLSNNFDSLSNNFSAETSINKNGLGGHLELLEERPVINKERLGVGKVTVTKHVRTKTITVPIELIEEYVTVRTDYYDDESQDLLVGNYDEKDILRHVEPSLDSNAVITINGKQVEIGDAPIEIIISRQVVTITKDTYAIQEVAVSKTTHIHTDSIQVALRHEELEVQEEGFLEHEGKGQFKK